ncbi:class D beta-lactamase [Chitinimonas lacunae]|uniref:Class D beta-lactamase n=1 Tax=Chitinimonas lacunae TaxID=1963018 RepID=A0ABV8MN89_9NEIS
MSLLRALLGVLLIGACQAAETRVETSLNRHFRAAGIEGVFVLYEAESDRYTVSDPVRAKERFVPASTYKIPNSLIALETGAVKSVDEVLPYAGANVTFKLPEWERDMNLREAMKMSNVPIYQNVARRIGQARMQQWVTRIAYGNADIGQQIDRFWLDGPLKISALEQANFTTRLGRFELPFSTGTVKAVREIIQIDREPNYGLFAKTGWSGEVGWWAGWVEQNGRVYGFALNADISKTEDLPKRLAVARACLAQLGLLGGTVEKKGK